MRIWYVVGDREYFLEPDAQETKTGRLRVIGCRLYDAEGRYRGWWAYKTMPREVQVRVREAIKAYLKRCSIREREHAIWQFGLPSWKQK